MLVNIVSQMLNVLSISSTISLRQIPQHLNDDGANTDPGYGLVSSGDQPLGKPMLPKDL